MIASARFCPGILKKTFFVIPMPMMAPIKVCPVLTGIPSEDAIKTDEAVPNKTQNPAQLERLVRLDPVVVMTLDPKKKRPRDEQIDP